MNKSDDETLTFKEMVGKFDVTPRTLRYYEYLELLKPTLQGRERSYDRKQIELLPNPWTVSGVS